MKTATVYAWNVLPAGIGAAALVWLCVRRMPEFCDTPVGLLTTVLAAVLGTAAALVLYPRGGVR